MRNTRLGLVAAIVATLALLSAACGGGSDDSSEAAPTTDATTTAAATPPPPPPPPATQPSPPPPPPAPQVETIRIVVKGGKPVGGIQRPSVKQGEKVRIVVRSDIADEVHVHGYDLMRDVAPGAPVSIVFTADIPGRFEVELEDRGLQLAEFEVTP
jgi:hypothetical protein